MNRPLAWLVCLPLLAACAAAPEEETDAGRKYERQIVDVSGQVKLHPLEVKWRTDQSMELPSLEGLTVKVEDALKATASQPALESTTSDADGRFSVPDVDVTNVTLALVASVDDPSGVLAPCGYGLVRGQPEGDLTDMPVYVVSAAFLDHIAAPTGLLADELLDLGFMFVQFVDKTGETALPEAKLGLVNLSKTTVLEDSEENPLWYLDETLTGVHTGTSTSDSGVLLYVPAFGAKEYTGVKDGTSFEVKLAGARKGFVLSVFIHAE